jgi:hypothetical protein
MAKTDRLVAAGIDSSAGKCQRGDPDHLSEKETLMVSKSELDDLGHRLAGRAVILVAAAIALSAAGARLRAASQPVLRVHVGERAPNFTLPAANGGTMSLSSFAGRNVLLDFYEGYW